MISIDSSPPNNLSTWTGKKGGGGGLKAWYDRESLRVALPAFLNIKYLSQYLWMVCSCSSSSSIIWSMLNISNATRVSEMLLWWRHSLYLWAWKHVRHLHKGEGMLQYMNKRMICRLVVMESDISRLIMVTGGAISYNLW